MKVTKLYPFAIVRPCVGCGYCCKTSRCAASYFEYKDIRNHNCPYLYFENNRYWCKVADKFKNDLAIGEGCCSPLNSFRSKYANKKS